MLRGLDLGNALVVIADFLVVELTALLVDRQLPLDVLVGGVARLVGLVLEFGEQAVELRGQRRNLRFEPGDFGEVVDRVEVHQHLILLDHVADFHVDAFDHGPFQRLDHHRRSVGDQLAGGPDDHVHLRYAGPDHGSGQKEEGAEYADPRGPRQPFVLDLQRVRLEFDRFGIEALLFGLAHLARFLSICWRQKSR